MPDMERVQQVVVELRDRAMAMVQDERGVRVEDYLTTLAAAVGEAVIVDAQIFDIEANDMTPGSAVFGDAINQVLSGDATDVGAADPMSVVGLLRDQIAALGFAAVDDLGDIGQRYRFVVEHVNASEWGRVATSVPDENTPRVLPLQMAFQLRPFVVAGCEHAGIVSDPVVVDAPLGWGRRIPITLALVAALQQTAGAIDPAIAVALSLDVIFGMAKVVPMSIATMQRLAAEGGFDVSS